MINYKKNEINEFNNLLAASSIMLVISIFTMKTFIASAKLEVVLLFFTLVLLFIYYLKNNGLIILYTFDIMWLFFGMYFVLSIIFQGNYTKVHLLDIIIFGFIIIFLILYKLDSKYFILSMKLMLIFSLIYALSGIFHYAFTDLYTNLILPKFSENQIETITRLQRGNNYTGFTTQTAFLAGFLVFGMGIAFSLYRVIKSKLFKILIPVSIIIMIYSLFLTGKRAHLLFMTVALLIMFIFSIEIKQITKKTIKLITSISIMIITAIITVIIYQPSSDSQLGKIYNKLYRTYEGLITGEGDITNGRIYLYERAIELFKTAPIFGIGWRKFHEMSLGIINEDIPSHPHNIYLQLLTELGIIGFLLFMIPVIYILIKTITIRLDSEVYSHLNIKWKVVMQFSLFIQIFFLLYGITGNLLTDHIFLLMYFFAVAIILSVMKHIQHKEVWCGNKNDLLNYKN